MKHSIFYRIATLAFFCITASGCLFEEEEDPEPLPYTPTNYGCNSAEASIQEEYTKLHDAEIPPAKITSPGYIYKWSHKVDKACSKGDITGYYYFMIDRKADSFVTLQMTYSISSEKGYTYKEVTPTMKTNLGFDVNTYEAKFGPQNFCSGCAADGTLSYEMTMEMFIDPVVGNVDSFILKNFYDIDFSSSHVSAEW